jgi:D-tagatose-1,6-bisphosphate aldolase subunit GatZ/KbaZ
MSEILRDIIARNKAGECIAIPSVCSAHPEVISASLQLASRLNRPLVIEATSNQVNQFGGYTGMDAKAFVACIDDLKSKNGISPNLIELGGDHLGPQVWKSETAEMAMAKARELVSDYVRAGINKIHLDCSEGCAGEPLLIDNETAAERAASLAVSCLDAASAPEELLFVIGTEVPPPGGARLDDNGHVIPTSPVSAAKTLIAHRNAFANKGIADLWPQVSGLVVQPGVEFGPDQIFNLPADVEPGLRDVISDYPGICLEAHSTDYQPPETFLNLAKMGFAFQKVGPALTFALRRALYALDEIVQKLTPSSVTLPMVMEAAMRENPKHWRSYYSEDEKFKWHFSYADRIRYYWPLPIVQEAVENLISTFDELKVSEQILAESFSLSVLDRSEGLAPSRGSAIVRSEVQSALLPYFLQVARP